VSEQFVNYGLLSLAVSCGAGDTSITLGGPGVGSLPAGGTYRLLVDNELMLAGSRSGGLVQVTRGIEGTSASGHSSSTAVVATSLTSGSFSQLIADLAAGRGGTVGLCGYGSSASYAALPTDRLVVLDSSGWTSQPALLVTLPTPLFATQRVALNEDGWVAGRPPFLVSGGANPLQPYRQSVQTSSPRADDAPGVGANVAAVPDLGAQVAWTWTGTFWALG
jgi:hypothetical protein